MKTIWNRVIIIFVTLLILLILWQSDNIEYRDDNGSKKVEIYYLPFEVWTYAPVTIDSIEEQSNQYGKVDIDNMRFKSFIENAKKSRLVDAIGLKFIRVKIIMPNGEIIYIDKSHVMKFDNEIRVMSEKTFQKFNELLKLLKEK